MTPPLDGVAVIDWVHEPCFEPSQMRRVNHRVILRHSAVAAELLTAALKNLSLAATPTIMRDLATLANLAEILGAIVVIGGVVFAVIQIRLFRRQRLEAAAIEVLRSWQSPEFARAFSVIRQLPDGVSAAKLRGHVADCENLAIIIGNTFESFGVMVYRRIVPLELVDELVGGSVVLLWRKLATWVEESRKESSQDTVYEWFQWLAERLQEHPGFDMLEGAHVKHRDWKP